MARACCWTPCPGTVKKEVWADLWSAQTSFFHGMPPEDIFGPAAKGGRAECMTGSVSPGETAGLIPARILLRRDHGLFAVGGGADGGDGVEIPVDEPGGDLVLQVLLDLPAQVPGAVGL